MKQLSYSFLGGFCSLLIFPIFLKKRIHSSGKGGLAGASAGLVASFLSVLLSNRVLELIYLFLIGLAVILLFLPLPLDSDTYKGGNFNKTAGIGIGLGVGSFVGLLGIGGGFIIIPLMVYILRIPLRVTIGTSLLIILVSSLGTIPGKFTVGHIDFLTTLLVLLGSVVGALLGAHLNRRVCVGFLRWALFSALVLIFLIVGYEIVLK
jgi:uncharacterized membrane protein YfcA